MPRNATTELASAKHMCTGRHTDLQLSHGDHDDNKRSARFNESTINIDTVERGHILRRKWLFWQSHRNCSCTDGFNLLSCVLHSWLRRLLHCDMSNSAAKRAVQHDFLHHLLY